jgi:hypothetical protein
LDVDLRVFRTLTFFAVGVETGTDWRGSYTLKSAIVKMLIQWLFIIDITDRLFLCFLQIGELKAECNNLISKISGNIVIFFRIMLNKFAIEFDQFGEIFLRFDFLECLLLAQYIVDEFFLKTLEWLLVGWRTVDTISFFLHFLVKYIILFVGILWGIIQ